MFHFGFFPLYFLPSYGSIFLSSSTSWVAKHSIFIVVTLEILTCIFELNVLKLIFVPCQQYEESFYCSHLSLSLLFVSIVCPFHCNLINKTLFSTVVPFFLFILLVIRSFFPQVAFSISFSLVFYSFTMMCLSEFSFIYTEKFSLGLLILKIAFVLH